MRIYVYTHIRKEVSTVEKECCQIKVTETDEGYRIDVSGKGVKEGGCCMPLIQNCMAIKANCCPPAEEGKK